MDDEGIHTVTNNVKLVCELVEGEYVVRPADDGSSTSGPVREAADDPFEIGVTAGQKLSVRLPDDDVTKLVALLTPHDSERERLLEEWEENGDYVQREEAAAVGQFYVNGEEWGWCVLDESKVLWPIPKGATKERFRISAWMSASMTGAYLKAGVRTYGRVALVWFEDDESNREGSIAELHYMVEDWDRLLDDAVSALMHDWWDRLCPFCEEEDSSGWECDVSFTSEFTAEGLGRSLAQIFRPCDDHRDEAGAGRPMQAVTDRDWRWVEDRWLPVSAQA